jgi:hypothetical protein
MYKYVKEEEGAPKRLKCCDRSVCPHKDLIKEAPDGKISLCRVGRPQEDDFILREEG